MTFVLLAPDSFDTAQTVTVTGVQDANIADESVTLTVASGSLSQTVAVTVVDDDIDIDVNTLALAGLTVNGNDPQAHGDQLSVSGTNAIL